MTKETRRNNINLTFGQVCIFHKVVRGNFRSYMLVIFFPVTLLADNILSSSKKTLSFYMDLLSIDIHVEKLTLFETEVESFKEVVSFKFGYK